MLLLLLLHCFRSARADTQNNDASKQDDSLETKKVLHLTANPTAKQNSKNNKNGTALVDGNTKLTQYFQIRRSARKTKKEVEQETLKSYEMAIINKRAEGLEVCT